MNESQKADMDFVFGKLKNIGNLDYVTAWYKKAVTIMEGTPMKAAFVSTNSISQGEQPAILWKPLMEQGVFINFGVQSFKWHNEAKGKAAVHCVIVGFSYHKTTPNINPYLVEAPNVFIESRNNPLCDVPPIGIGNKPIDDGNFLFSEDEMLKFVEQEPLSKKYFRPWFGSHEFINGYNRYCLWLGDCPASELRKMPEAMKRIEAVRQYRLASKSASTRKLADTPTRFHVENMPSTNFIVIPGVSSERRKYIPIGFLSPDVLCGDKLRIIPNGTLYHFGILTSNVHMAWMRAVCCRLKSDYSYSNNVVYNNFPWPVTTEDQKSDIEKLAQAILDARAKDKASSLADLYDPLAMPKELLKAHQSLDRAVMKLYGFAKDTTETDIVAALMARYQELTTRSKH